MSKNKTRHILAARHILSEPDSKFDYLVANTELNTYVWAGSVKEAEDILEGRSGAYKGAELYKAVRGWLTGSYPEGFVKVVVG